MKDKKRYVIGDIHGNKKALSDVLNMANFNFYLDTLFMIGDICDGHKETYEVIETLMKIKDIRLIEGNHDVWLKMFLNNEFDKFFTQEDVLKGENFEEKIILAITNMIFDEDLNLKLILSSWYNQGGRNTLLSYVGRTKEDLIRHRDFLSQQEPFILLEDEKYLFVHGGFELRKDVNNTDIDVLLWDRDIFSMTFKNGYMLNHGYDKVFLGHTTTQIINNDLKPLIFNNIYALDTGAGWDGKLSMMNIDTDDVFSSKISKEYYPEFTGR